MKALLGCIVGVLLAARGSTPFRTSGHRCLPRFNLQQVAPRAHRQWRAPHVRGRWAVAHRLRMAGTEGDCEGERERLERLFEATTPYTSSDAGDGVKRDSTETGHFDRLPLWTVQAGRADFGEIMPLPGLQEMWSIREPHQIEMFEGLKHQKNPLFAAVTSECEPGSVATLMEVASWCSLPDKLVIRVLGVGRLRIDEIWRESGGLHDSAECVVLPDEEEIQYHLPTGTGQVMAKIRKLEALSQDVLATLEDGYFQRASLLVALRAAAAWSLSWRPYEAPATGTNKSSIGLSDAQEPCDLVALDLAVQPEDMDYIARSAANKAALSYTPEALRLVGYKPMVREYLQGGGVLGAGLDGDAELMPPSWLEVIDHFAARDGHEEGQDGEKKERKEMGGMGEPAADDKNILGAVTKGMVDGKGGTKQFKVVELEDGMVVGGKWGGQVHGRGGAELESTLIKREAEIWALLHELVESCGGGVGAAEEGGTVEGGGGGRVRLALPVELRQMHPAIAHPAWPAVRRVQRLSYAALAAIGIADLGPLRYVGRGGGGQREREREERQRQRRL
jgi:hypothetical protein